MGILIKDVYKTYNRGRDSEVRALRGIDLNIEDGELTAIVGASGSGKSTLLHILGCLDADFEGRYILDGREVKELSGRELARLRNGGIGIVLQSFGLIGNMSVFDNVAVPVYLGGKYDKKALRGRVTELLQSMGLADKMHTNVDELSGGQKQRVAIARALINSPRLILADEPTGALDRKTSQEIMNELERLNKEGYTVVIVTHDPEVAKRCRRTVEISDGKAVG